MSAIGAVLAAALAVLACGDHPGGTPTTPISVRPVAITIGGRTSPLEPGDASQLTAAIEYSDGTTKDASSDVTWSAGPSSVISITQGGLQLTVTASSSCTTLPPADVTSADRTSK